MATSPVRRSQAMPPRAPRAEPMIYQLKITLKHSRPPIWRRLQVSGDTRLDQLHEIIQTAMGWHDIHLHAFDVGGVEYTFPYPDSSYVAQDERRVTLARVARRSGAKCRCQYDFGDDWQHEVLVEKILPPEPDATYPVCLKGRRACPPEDSGGPWGYANLLAALAGASSRDHELAREWIDPTFNPET